MIRKKVLAARKVAKADDRGDKTALLSRVLAGFHGMKLGGYMPIHSEIDPLPAMRRAAVEGVVGVPVIIGPDQPLEFSRWTPDSPLRDGPFGASVPVVDDFFDPDIFIVPLVAFTREGDRLGYGGGFYDRTLALARSKRPVLAIGFAYAVQEVPTLPVQKTDQALDMIVTERDFFDCRLC